MKRIISKILIILIILVMLFEFTCSSPISYAIDIRTDMESWINRITSLMGGLISIKLWLFRLQATTIVVTVLDLATNVLAESCGISSDPFFDGTKAKPMTPIDIFFNKYAILDINFFEIEGRSWLEAAIKDDIINNLRKSVASWYYTLRTISVIILLCILTYVGIRMALSTIADEKAKYQKMLYDWICSLILVFVLQYIIIFTIEANNGIVHFFREALLKETGPFTYTSMDGILGTMALQATTGIGMGSFIAIAALCMVAFQTIAFFLAYLNRMLKIAFLIIISPLISITYSIDKIGDGKAQALNSWLKEFVYTILIQPFHIVLYMAFANTAMALLSTTNPWLGVIDNMISGGYSEIVNAVLVILCLKFVNDGEKIIRKIFNFQDDSSSTSMAAGAAVGLAALNTMKKGAQIGTKAAGVVNKFGGTPARFAKAFQNSEQLNKVKAAFNQTGVGKMLQSPEFKNKMDKLGNTMGKIGENKIVNGGLNIAKKGAEFAGKGIGKIGDGVKKAISGYKNIKGKIYTGKNKDRIDRLVAANKRYLPKTLALMGAAMSYATGTSGAMQAIGVGNAFMQGTEGYFSASGGSLAKESGDLLMDQLRDDDEEYQENAQQLEENAAELSDVRGKLKQSNANINGIAQHGLKRENDQTPQDALNAYEQDWEVLKQKRASGDTEGAKALEEDMKSRSSSMFTAFEERDKLKEREKELLKNQEALEDKRREIDERLAKTDVSTLMEMLKKFDIQGQKGKIEKAKAEILRNIQKAMIEKKMRADGKDPAVDSSDGYELTDDEQTDAKAMQQRMLMHLDRSVLKTGDNYNTRQAVQQAFGQENDCGSALLDSLNTYKLCKRGEQYAANRDNYVQFGGEDETFQQKTIKKATGQKHGIKEFLTAPPSSSESSDEASG